jgi:alkanesulfonate monooxygenase SsuD/methylene tetrahydromethanopterin reductase-like flavin-dependent oxidoreductase (luciferase family)
MAKAAGMTDSIVFGSGIRQLPLHNPVSLVQEANMLDNVTRGRYMFGYGGTHLVSLDQLDMRGIDIKPEDTRPMVFEGVEFLLRCWTSEGPFDFDGRYWHGTNIEVLPRPFQRPHPPIAAACQGSVDNIEVAGRNGFHALFGRGQDRAEDIRQWAEIYSRAARSVGIAPDPSKFRVVRVIYVDDTDEKARNAVRKSANDLLALRKAVLGDVYLKQRLKPGMTMDQLTFDYMCDEGYYWVGSPDTVHAYIVDYFEKTGGFGVLLHYAGTPFGTLRQRTRSMRLFAESVAPRLKSLTPTPATAAVS